MGTPLSPPASAGTVPELSFSIEDGGPLVPAAVPTLRFGVRVASPPAVPIRALALAVDVRIAAPRRRYEAGEREALLELFGLPEQWGRSLRTLHWTSVALNVPPFSGDTTVDLHVPCTYDFEVAATKYLNALAGGHVPLEFLFSGTVFYTAEHGRLQVGRIAWDREADFQLPVAAWRETMDRHFPGSAWLRLRRESLDRLQAYKARKALPGFEEAIDSLLDAEGA